MNSKETDIKNRTCYYFNDIMRNIDINFSDFFLDLCIRFDKINGFIKIYDGIRYLVLLDYARCDKIFGRIKYLISYQ